MDHPAADPEEARDEPDAEAVERAAAQRHRVDVALARAIDELTPLEMSSWDWERPAFPSNHPDGEQAEDGGHDPVENVTGDGADNERAADRARQGRNREHGT